jgi:hypothetical protein
MSRNSLYSVLGFVLLLSAIFIVFGGIIIAISLFPLPTTSVSGQVVSAKVVAEHLRMTISGDSRLFDITPGDLHPTPPASLPAGTRVTVWVKQGQEYVMALEVTDGATQVTRKYTTSIYDDPEGAKRGGILGGVASIAGGIAIAALGWLALPLIARVIRRIRPRSRYVPAYMAGEAAPPPFGDIKYPPRY